jgi:hypothetical protein
LSQWIGKSLIQTEKKMKEEEKHAKEEEEVLNFLLLVPRLRQSTERAL